MRRAEEYPFDPRANILALHGADKVRAVADRELAGYMLALLDCIEGRPEPARPARQLALPQPARWSSCLEATAA